MENFGLMPKMIQRLRRPARKKLRIKRVYEVPTSTDGVRILVDRLWPRGLRKDSAHIDYWLKDVAPSPHLRTWFDHRADRFDEFQMRYLMELETNDSMGKLRALIRGKSATLLYAAKDIMINHAIILQNFLSQRTLSQSRRR